MPFSSRTLLSLALLTSLSGPLYAQSYYQCDSGGNKTYQSTPCESHLGTNKARITEYEKLEQEKQAAADQLKKDLEQETVRLSAERTRKETERQEAIVFTANLSGRDESAVSMALSTAEQSLTFSGIHSSTVCRIKWLERGRPNSDMYDYCRKENNLAAQNIKNTILSTPSEKYYPSSLLYCWNKWRKNGVTNPIMTDHCLQKEAEAWDDLRFLQNKYGHTEINNLAYYGFRKYGSWEMAVYHAKKALNIN
jgi:hypothetical protein